MGDRDPNPYPEELREGKRCGPACPRSTKSFLQSRGTTSLIGGSGHTSAVGHAHPCNSNNDLGKEHQQGSIQVRRELYCEVPSPAWPWKLLASCMLTQKISTKLHPSVTWTPWVPFPAPNKIRNCGLDPGTTILQPAPRITGSDQG
jgi:hypothetical protein